MIVENEIKKIVKPVIKIDTEKNIFKINDIDLRLFCYWDITFSRGEWYFTVKNREEDDNDIIEKAIADSMGEKFGKALITYFESIKD